jgi:hypothetical protein
MDTILPGYASEILIRARRIGTQMSDNRKDLTAMAITALIAVVCVIAIVLMDFQTQAGSRGGDGMITASVVARAGAIATPSEPPPHLAAPKTMPAVTP